MDLSTIQLMNLSRLRLTRPMDSVAIISGHGSSATLSTSAQDPRRSEISSSPEISLIRQPLSNALSSQTNISVSLSLLKIGSTVRPQLSTRRASMQEFSFATSHHQEAGYLPGRHRADRALLFSISPLLVRYAPSTGQSREQPEETQQEDRTQHRHRYRPYVEVHRTGAVEDYEDEATQASVRYTQDVRVMAERSSTGTTRVVSKPMSLRPLPGL